MIKTLDEAVYHFKNNHYGDLPTYIIMHPNSWFNVVGELMKGNYLPEPHKLDYKGIAVLRSYDMEENTFKLFL